MKKATLLFTAISTFAWARYSSHISPITLNIKKRMVNGGSWRRGCPVGLNDLRYLTMTYRGFDGKDHKGEMIVHKDRAREVTQIFGELYRQKYPIRKMRLVSDYGADDFASIEADNTSAFNCRPVTGGTKWSKHSYGKAIDINPLENPYVSRSGHISHKASLKYRDRRHHTNTSADKAMMTKGDPIVRIFKKRGWRWGGDWHSIKDYQHFDKGGRTPSKKRKTHKKPNIKKLFDRSGDGTNY